MFILRSEAEMLVVKLNMEKEIANKMAENLKCLSIAFVIHLICGQRKGRTSIRQNNNVTNYCNKCIKIYADIFVAGV